MSTAGYSGTPLIKKLGIKGGQRITLINQPTKYLEILGALPSDAIFLTTLEEDLDFIHFFTKERAQLEIQFPLLKGVLVYNGMLWISWPKKASKVASDLDENIVRKIGLSNGLVDVKVAAIDQVWSGLKFVYRLEDRPAG